MRITYRSHGVKDYWDARWSDIPADVAMTNCNAYPLKYALQTISSDDGLILEAGCGAGRILRYFHDRGYKIEGFDYIQVAIDKLRVADPNLHVETGDITSLKYSDCSYRYLLAFGLYHNLEHDLSLAVDESWRVLESNGRLCASFRADNIQTALIDWLADRRLRKSGKERGKFFHKSNLTRKEFCSLFENAGFSVESVYPVENMPIMYKFSMFRAYGHKSFDENKARAEGYRLSPFGQIFQDFLMRFFPDQFCNIYVLIARKP